MAVRSDIKASDNWFQAEDKDLEFTIYQADGVTAQDLTQVHHTFRWTLQQTAERPSVLTLDAQITDAEEGLVSVAIHSNDTAALPPGDYVHELWRVDQDATYLATFGDAVLQPALLPPDIIITGIDGGTPSETGTAFDAGAP